MFEKHGIADSTFFLKNPLAPRVSLPQKTACFRTIFEGFLKFQNYRSRTQKNIFHPNFLQVVATCIKLILSPSETVLNISMPSEIDFK